MEYAKYYSVSYKRVTVYYSRLGIECEYGRLIWSMLNITASLINVLQYIIVGWELNVSMAGSYGVC